jgi:hypothetical protein
MKESDAIQKLCPKSFTVIVLNGQPSPHNIRCCARLCMAWITTDAVSGYCSLMGERPKQNMYLGGATRDRDGAWPQGSKGDHD